MLLNRAGIFHAVPTVAVGETGPNKLATAMISYAITEEKGADGQFYGLAEGESFTITGYHYLERKDQTLNERTIEDLKAALGWDGVDVATLQNTDYAEKLVQVVCDFEEYNGQNRLKVKYLNPYGATGGAGGVKPAEASEIKSLQGRMGAKLRAMSGGTAVKSAPPAKKLAPPPPAKKAEGCTREQAWEAVVANCVGEPADAWANLIDECKITDEAAATPADWARLAKLAECPL